MIIGFVKELPQWEYRTALIPETVRRLRENGYEVIGESGAGVRAGYADETYRDAGAELYGYREVWRCADMMLKIWAPSESEEKYLREGLWIAANFESTKYPERISVWKRRKIKALALERLPRLSRVQDLDILSSQDSLAGYKAALTAMNMQNRSVPLMMTSAGTLLPLKALVIGAGVAGLQAIATLQRAGAQVTGADIRPETEEQVLSLGARFIAAEKAKISELLPQCGIVITAAYGISGRVPLLIDENMLNLLPEGAVAVDMAAGNIAGSVNGKVLQIGKIMLLASNHLAADVAGSASYLYSGNMHNLVTRLVELQKDAEVWQQIFISGKGES